MPSRLKPINWRLLGLHLLGIPFMALGMQELFLIRQVWLIRLGLRYGDDAWKHIPANYLQAETVNDILMWQLSANPVGILLGCLLLSIIVWRRRESWLLPVLLFVGGILLNWSQLYSLSYLHNLLIILRGSIEAANIHYRLAILGAFLVLIGMLPFLFTWQRPVQERN
ncbi:hypothetical protein FY528_04605 [Hymenobacter lutimineralis]|uniref:Uncharacterized protein n=1 Tax=Hymenobacter lutimineralis TaxID=2606448 RepID=A0A5D6V9M3_9BACT|nr:hypothetical protein [Hymenobacter lutimineralis]TYZ12583.1 hypothetical protein FY528_04605 [Hymenobacter lutimineralis]